MTKEITLIVHDELERVVASLTFKEEKEFVILTPAQAVALIPLETIARPKFVNEIIVAQGMTPSERCYTPKEFDLGVQKKDQGKRTISEGESQEFQRKIEPKDYSIVKNLGKTPAKIFIVGHLMSSQLYRQDLKKALDIKYVPMGTSIDNVAAMIN